MTTRQLKKLEELAAARIGAKRAEEAAAEERKRIDEEIAALVKGEVEGEYGTASVKLGELGLKVTTSFGYTRSISADFEKDFDKLPAQIQAIAKWKPSIVEANWKALDAKDQAFAAKYVTTKASSPSVKIEVI